MTPRPLRSVVSCTDGLHAMLRRVMPAEQFVDWPANDNSTGPVAA
jgi:hypothetical protein